MSTMHNFWHLCLNFHLPISKTILDHSLCSIFLSYKEKRIKKNINFNIILIENVSTFFPIHIEILIYTNMLNELWVFLIHTKNLDNIKNLSTFWTYDYRNTIIFNDILIYNNLFLNNFFFCKDIMMQVYWAMVD